MLYVRDGLDGKERALIDPNAMGGAEHTTALDWWVPSEEGEWLAYGLSDGGSEDSVLHVLDVASGRPHGDVIPETRHALRSPGRPAAATSTIRAIRTRAACRRRISATTASCTATSSGGRRRRIRWSSAPSSNAPTFRIALFLPNGRWLAVTVGRGWSESHLYLSDRSRQNPTFTRVSPEGEFLYAPLPQDDALYVMTNEGAPRYRIFASTRGRRSATRWQLVIPEHPADVLRRSI